MDTIDLVKLMIPILASFIGSVIVLWQKLNRNQEKLFIELHSLKELLEFKVSVQEKHREDLTQRVKNLEEFKDSVLRSGIISNHRN
jgi:chaperonin cofactor prefoldin